MSLCHAICMNGVSGARGNLSNSRPPLPIILKILPKGIAALPTSNTGTIFLGISDEGELIGLKDVESQAQRDKLVLRVANLCNSVIKPAITPYAHWAVEDSRIVLVITVPKGPEPVYYHNGRPIVRHLASSRIAEPHEVLSLIREHLNRQFAVGDEDDSDGETGFYSQLASLLIQSLIWLESPGEHRHVNPWLEESRACYASIARSLRDLSATTQAETDSIDVDIREYAKSLDDLADFRLYLGCGEAYGKLESQALALSAKLRRLALDKRPLSEKSIEQVIDLVKTSGIKLDDLASRAAKRADMGRFNEVQIEASEIGWDLAQVVYYDLSKLGDDVGSQLRDIAMRLRSIEVARIYMDGGQSIDRQIMEIGALSTQLIQLGEKWG